MKKVDWGVARNAMSGITKHALVRRTRDISFVVDDTD